MTILFSIILLYSYAQFDNLKNRRRNFKYTHPKYDKNKEKKFEEKSSLRLVYASSTNSLVAFRGTSRYPEASLISINKI